MRFATPAAFAPRLGAVLGLAVVLAGCASGPPRGEARTPGAPEPRPFARDVDGPGANPPPDLDRLPDAEPRLEAIRPGGANKPYSALGRDYVPSTRDAPFSERGLASWYGAKFHGRRTASAEVYDMYAMTAAHPTLPIPSYARIRNPANGREIVVRINDRGPFHPGRIVDLSYAAAAKLDLLRGVAPVELERITSEDIRTGAWRGGPTRVAAAALPEASAPAITVPSSPAPSVASMAPASPSIESASPSRPPTTALQARDIAFVATATAAPVADASTPLIRAASAAARGFWIQLGAFRERDGAESFRRRIGADDAAGWLAPLLAVFGDAALYRVQAGPYLSRDEAQNAAQRARSALGIVPLIVERR